MNYSHTLYNFQYFIEIKKTQLMNYSRTFHSTLLQILANKDTK